MRKGEPSLPDERVKELTKKHYEGIAAKCHPAIFEMAQCWKEAIEDLKKLGSTPSAEATQKLEARLHEQTEQIRRKYSGKIPPPPGHFAAQVIFTEKSLGSADQSQGFAEWLHFQRHGTPLKSDTDKTLAKDWKASRRLQRTVSDVERLRCGQGPIRPFKADLEHWNMFEVLWGFGIESLTPTELADFFDTYCPCNSGEPHDPDALGKQRKRFQDALRSGA